MKKLISTDHIKINRDKDGSLFFDFGLFTTSFGPEEARALVLALIRNQWYVFLKGEIIDVYPSYDAAVDFVRSQYPEHRTEDYSIVRL